MNYMFILLCELFIVLEYDEMNCDFVSGVFLYNVFWSANFGYAITMNSMLEWMIVLNLLRLKDRNSEHRHVKCKFVVTIMWNIL